MKYQFINKEKSKIVKLDSQGNEKKDSFTQSEIKRFPKKLKEYIEENSYKKVEVEI